MSFFIVYIRYIVPASVLVPLTLGLYRFNTINKSYRFLVAFLAFSAFSSILARIFAIFYHNNTVVIKSYTVGEFFLLAGFYYCKIKSRGMQCVIVVLTAMFTLFSIALILIFFSSDQFDDYSTTLESLLMIFFGLVLINNESSTSTIVNAWGQNSTNWFNTGILLYFSGSLFIFLLANYIPDPSSLIFKIAWIMHATFLLLLSVLFTKGFLLVSKRSAV